MRAADVGVITQYAPGTDRAAYTFHALLAFRDRSLLQTCR